jgi:dihydrolipoamide dehydrogenase
MLPGILPGADRDLVRPLERRLKKEFEQICLETKVTGMKEVDGGVELTYEGKSPPSLNVFEKVLVSVGRVPNARDVNPDAAGVELDQHGFVKVDSNFQTTAPNIFAIGDVIGNPMLAHKAAHEGTVLADRLAGKDAVFAPKAIPAVVFTDPEIAWAGLTEGEAREQGLDIVVKKLPWGASGRAVALGRPDGLTKMIFDQESRRLIGVGMTGVHVGEMIAESALALEMGGGARDIARTIHPHPTLSETLGEVAEMALS